MTSLRTSVPFPWIPSSGNSSSSSSSLFSAKLHETRRFVNNAVQAAAEARIKATTLKSDFGPGLPASRPDKPCIYVIEPAQHRGSFRRYMNMAHEEFPLLASSVACVFVYSTATLAIPHGFGQLIDYASRGEMPYSLSYKLLSWFGVAGIGNFGLVAVVFFVV